MSGDPIDPVDPIGPADLAPRIDALTAADAPRCAELEAILFPGDDPWGTEAFLAELAQGHHYLAARRGGRLVGYAGIALLPAPRMSDGGSDVDGPAPLRSVSEVDGPAPLRSVSEAEVHTIGLDTAEQGRGLGRVLLRELLVAADRIGAAVHLEVRTDNGAALALYRSEGFAVVGTRRGYYASGADAHTMCRPAGTARPPAG